MHKHLRRIVFTAAAAMTLSSCTNAIGTGSDMQEGPVGTGSSINELKKTPCACTEIPMSIPRNMRA